MTALWLSAAAMPIAAAAQLTFERHYVDLAYGGNGRPGWVRAGDMDGDGDLEIVAGGGYALFVYENTGNAGSWTRWGNLDAAGAIGANGAVLSDIDDDGDLDVFSARYYDDLGWWENPGPPLGPAPWTFHAVHDTSRYLHDLIVADLDGDGVAEEFVPNLNQGYWSARITLAWLRPGAGATDPWEVHTIEADRAEGPPHGHAGLDVGDIDGDGHVDLAYANGWYEAPDDPAGTWTWHQVTAIYGISNALVRDMNADGRRDLVVSAGHHGSGVYWLEAPEDPIGGVWTRHDIAPDVHHPECLAVLDLWGDGDLDVVSCDLFFGEAPGEPGWNEQVHNVYVFENLGQAASWAVHNISPDSYPSHLLQAVEMDGDGRVDLISEATGTSVVTFYRNLSSVPPCPDDPFEEDDSCPSARPLGRGSPREHKLCDEDWLAMTLATGATYEAATFGLSGGADTSLELYGPGCGDFVAADDDSGPGAASLLTWTATQAGTYHLRTAGATYGPGRGYSVVWECVLDCGLCSGPQQVTLEHDSVAEAESHEACASIRAGPDYRVLGSGVLTLRAGEEVALVDGFVVETGGGLEVVIDRSLR